MTLLQVDKKGTRQKPVTEDNPLAVSTPEYEDDNRANVVNVTGMANLLDAMERIQQQLGLITGINLARGERL